MYPLFPIVYSIKPSQPLHPPSSCHRINFSKPSQPLLPPSWLHRVKYCKPS